MTVWSNPDVNAIHGFGHWSEHAHYRRQARTTVKKRYSLYLTAPLARKFDLVAQQRHGSKSALFEEAMRASLEPQHVFGPEENLARSLNDLKKTVGTTAPDLAIVAELLALYVRYFLTMTPPLPESERQAAHRLGRERFQVFVAQVGRRLAGDHRLFSEILETIAVNNPDLFATMTDDAPLKRAGSAPGAAKTDRQARHPNSPAQEGEPRE